MKRVFLLIISCALFLSCSSDDENPVFDPNVTVNGSNFGIEYAYTFSELSETVQTTQFVLGYTNECQGCPYPPEYKRLILNLRTNPSESIEGTYEISTTEGTIGTITGGYYLSGYPISLYSGTITISKLGSNRYKLQFNTVKGHFYLDENTAQTVIEGYFDGNFEKTDTRFFN